MANSTALSAANTSTQMSDTARNRTPSTAREVIFITLIADGVAVTAANIYAALDAQFATVSSEKDSTGRNTFIFNIGP